MRKNQLLSLVLSVGAGTLFGCNDTAVVLRVVSDQHLDSLCVGLDAGGQHKFGHRYDLSGLALPQTLSVLAGGQGSFQESVAGYRRGIEVARVERQVAFKSQSIERLDVPLNTCVPSATASSAMFTTGATAAGAVGQAILLGVPTGHVVFSDRGTFSAATLEPVSTGANAPAGGKSQLLASDLDGDCQLDVVLMPEGTVATRDPGGGVVAEATAVAGGKAVASADLDGDGNPDLIVAGGASVKLLLGDGAGHFREQASAFDVQPSDATALAVGDLDGDGNADVVIAQGSAAPGVTRVYLNDMKGSGHFVFAPAALPPRPERTTALAIGDVDFDGDLDLVAAHSDGPVRLYINRGNAYLDDRSFTALPDQVTAVVPSLLLVDLNADCLPDLVVPRAGAAPLVWINAGGDSFALGAPLGGPEALGAAAGDLDGDGLPDLLLWGASGLALELQK